MRYDAPGMFLDLQPGNLIEPLTGRRWTGAESRVRVDARARVYAAAGLKRGDRVFLHFGNCNEFFAELLAVWSLGGCAVPIDPRFTSFEIENLASWSRPKFSAWLGAPDATLAAALEKLGTTMVDATAAVMATKSASAPDVRAATTSTAALSRGFSLDDDALILFTSGTTGQPKGVLHTHRSLRARWMALRSHLGLEAYARTLCLLPTHFGHGLICNCLFPWLSGCDLFIMPPFRPDTVSGLGRALDEHRITFMSSVPAVWRLALRIAKPPESGTLQRVFVGSAPLSAALWTDIQKWSGTSQVMNSYGITETGSWLAGTTVGAFTPQDGLIGVAWGGIVRVLKSREPSAPFETDAVCAPGESGHVWTLTPALMKGYLDRDDLTAGVVAGGWFATGDIGLVDERGWLFLQGRERDEINKGGMKVHPADIDAVIERFPATLDVCTFAYADALLGEDVGVAVALKDAGEATLRDLHRWAAQHLAKHQLPQRWYVVDEIPRTSRGKVSRANVAEQCAARTPVNIAALLRGAPPADGGGKG
jgi:acyl-CoA synthetase (AMP-forming)/AMP-acid ligase II